MVHRAFIVEGQYVLALKCVNACVHVYVVLCVCVNMQMCVCERMNDGLWFLHDKSETILPMVFKLGTHKFPCGRQKPLDIQVAIFDSDVTEETKDF